MEKYKGSSIINILKGVIISIALTIILLLIFAIILAYTDVDENTISPVIIGVTGVSLLIGSIIANLKNYKNGILNGAIIGGIYLLLLYIISSIANGKFGITLNSIIMIIIGIICGMIGGIIGVNKN